MKRVIGIVFVLLLGIALGIAAEDFREGGVSLVGKSASVSGWVGSVCFTADA